MIVTLLPINTRLPWIVPPVFRPELVPEELMAEGLTVMRFTKFFYSNGILIKIEFFLFFTVDRRRIRSRHGNTRQ